MIVLASLALVMGVAVVAGADSHDAAKCVKAETVAAKAILGDAKTEGYKFTNICAADVLVWVMYCVPASHPQAESGRVRQRCGDNVKRNPNQPYFTSLLGVLGGRAPSARIFAGNLGGDPAAPVHYAVCYGRVEASGKMTSDAEGRYTCPTD